MSELTWRQKAQAIQSLAGPFNFDIRVRSDGSWYINSPIERREGGALSSGLVKGGDPFEAIGAYWEWLTDSRYYLVLESSLSGRRAVRWNGFMWQDVQEEKQ